MPTLSEQKTSPFFRCEHITKSYDGVAVFSDISVTVKEGAFVSLLGPSGIGKTTLFRILSGLELPDAGRVYYQGDDITGQKGVLGYMQQEDLLLPHKTLIDNIGLPLVLRGQTKAAARVAVRPLLAQFGLAQSDQKYPRELSGGMRQRAALLRTYLFSGRLLLLDEPFSALDPITKNAMHQWYIKTVHGLGCTTLFITHDIDEAIFLSDQVYIMSPVPHADEPASPARIVASLTIDGAERDEEFLLSSRFTSYKRDILRWLRSE